ncbi:MAG: pilus assembly protein N-terminal domain-containing protein [Acidobacteria bacterium]|nr:pilus assembly protein N-terminal domain-containing protein [Acidobacteriota bacterium]
MSYSRFTQPFAHHFAAVFALAFTLFVLQPMAKAQEAPILKASFTRDAIQPINIDLLVGQSRVIELDGEVDATQFSGKDIVSVGVLTGRVIVVNALGIGQANVAVAKKLTSQNESEQVLVFHVFVQKNLTLIDNQIKVLYPKENIQLSQVNDSVVLSGSVTHPDIAKDVENILKTAKIDFSNLLKVPKPAVQQVQMEVRIAEVNRAALREIGAAFGVMNRTIPTFISPNGPAGASILGGLGQQAITLSNASAMNIFLGRADLTSAFINALQQRDALRSLAEPNIIAANGETGQFLSGGKIPVPQVTSATNGQSGFSVQYQPYGVSLKFVPTIKDENHISIKLDTEVSNISNTGAIRTNGITIPGLTVNSASTVLELADGQSFALAGLLNNRELISTSQIPGIGNIPLLGELFKSRRFERNESELMFLCTVRMVTPLNPDQIPRLPGAPPNNTSTSTKPDNNVPNLNGAPATLSLPASNLLEGESGHVVPKKVTKATPKTDN